MIVQIFHHNTHVANVTMTSMPKNNEYALERAYDATQNVMGSWSRDEFMDNNGKTHRNGDYNRVPGTSIEVVAPLPIHEGQTYGHRSSMVGDKFVIGDCTYEVSPIGFKLV